MDTYQYIDNICVQLLTGSYTKCWDTWGFTDDIPSYNKFYYITEGECFIKINGREYVAHKGQFFILPYGSIQTYHHISKDFITKYWFHCNIRCNDMDLFELINLPHVVNVDTTDESYIVELFQQILSFQTSNLLTSKFRQKAKVLELLSYFIDHTESTNNFLLKDNKLQMLMAYIEDNLDKQITINQLGQITHLHPNYFIRYFKEITGVPPIEYINNMRVERAKRLLQTEDLSIQDIAVQSGFSTAYYFSRLFRKKTGFTPSNFRKISLSLPSGDISAPL